MHAGFVSAQFKLPFIAIANPNIVATLETWIIDAEALAQTGLSVIGRAESKL